MLAMRGGVLPNVLAKRSAKVRQAILRASSAAEIARLHFLLGELYAKAVEKGKLRPDLVACHGQTIHHEGDPVRPTIW